MDGEGEGQLSRTRWMDRALPSSPISITTPCISSFPHASFEYSWMRVVSFLISISGSSPPTLSMLPVRPASVMTAVPPGRTLSSAVIAFVCVPTTAESFPSAMANMVPFSAVVAAWKSSTIVRVSAEMLSRSLGSRLKGFLR